MSYQRGPKVRPELILLDQHGSEIASTLILGLLDRSLNFALQLGKYSGEMPIVVSAQIRRESDHLQDVRIEKVLY